MNIFLTVIVTLIIFGILITTHEAGHLIAAKKCGVYVEEFSIGMGPLIFSIKGEEEWDTMYSIRLLPVGGYCRLYGEDYEEVGEGSLNSLSPIKKIIVFASGAFMNLITAFIALLLLYSIVGTTPTTTMDYILPNSPASKAGIVKGQTITQIEGKNIESWEDIAKAVDSSRGKEIEVTLEKDGKQEVKKLTPEIEKESNSYKIGITPTYKKTFLSVIKTSVYSFGQFIKLIFQALMDLLRGNVGIDQLSGPIGVASVINMALSRGFAVMLNITALLAINIGIFNLLPIPALDGSRIFFCLIEMIKGSPIDPKKEGIVHMVGFVALMAFAVFIAYQDVLRLL